MAKMKLEPMTFRDYIIQRTRNISYEYGGQPIDASDDHDWRDCYDFWEDTFFQSYMDAMESIGYEPEFGIDY